MFDGYFELRLGPWDVAAGGVIVREAGGVVTDWDGDDRAWLRSGNILAGPPAVHAALLELAGRHEGCDLGPDPPDPRAGRGGPGKSFDGPFRSWSDERSNVGRRKRRARMTTRMYATQANDMAGNARVRALPAVPGLAVFAPWSPISLGTTASKHGRPRRLEVSHP